MIEPLAHAVKGSVSRHSSVLSTATGSTRLSSAKPLKSNFFTPVPRPNFLENPPFDPHTPFELTAECRLWSCCPVRHSIWCPSRKGHLALEEVSRDGSRSRTRSNPQADFNRLMHHNNPYSPSSLHGQRRHASLLPKEAPPAGLLFSTIPDHPDLAPDPNLRQAITDQLVKKNFVKARKLLALYDRFDSFWYSKQLFVESYAGNTGKAEQHFAHFASLATPTVYEIRSLLMAYANSLDFSGLRQRFNELFASKSQHQLRIEYFYPAFHAMARASEANDRRLKEWRKRLVRAGFEPDPFIYSFIVQYYSKHDRTADVTSVFEEIRLKGCKVGVRVYQNGMTYFARRKDLEAVKTLFQRVLAEGQRPDLHLYTTLMHAHAQVHDWKGVLNIREEMKTNGVDPDRSIATFNVLLKAAYSTGAPYPTIRAQFQALPSLGLTPNAHTYCTVAQAAVESNAFADAVDYLQQMIDRNRTEPGFLNAHIFTIIIDGCLREGEAELANRVYSSMEEHGVQPTSLTFAKMLKGIAGLSQEKQRQVWKTLETPPMSEDWKVPSYGKLTWYEHVYVPQMQTALRSGLPSRVKDIYDHVRSIGEKPTLSMDLILLDAYRQLSNISGMRKIWTRMLRQASAAHHATDALKSRRTRRGGPPSDILAPALSIYLDAFSSAGLHARAIHAWNRYHAAGFRFDAHNWNHLVHVLVRAGLVRLAFEVVENVLLPLTSPLPASPSAARKSLVSPPLLSALFGTPPRFVIGRRRFRDRTRIARLRKQPKDSAVTRDVFSTFAQIAEASTTQGEWRIHNSVQRLLAATLRRLYNGFTISPVPVGWSSRRLNIRLNPSRAAKQLKVVMKRCPSAISHVCKSVKQSKSFRFRDNGIPLQETRSTTEPKAIGDEEVTANSENSTIKNEITQERVG